MARGTSLAEHYRMHRVAFTLAQELRCTPREAEAELQRRAARQRWEECQAKLEAKANRGPTRSNPHTGAPWMLQD